MSFGILIRSTSQAALKISTRKISFKKTFEKHSHISRCQWVDEVLQSSVEHYLYIIQQLSFIRTLITIYKRVGFPYIIWPIHSWNMDILKSKLYIPKIQCQWHGWGQSPRSKNGSNILLTHTHIFSCQPVFPFLGYDHQSTLTCFWLCACIYVHICEFICTWCAVVCIDVDVYFSYFCCYCCCCCCCCCCWKPKQIVLMLMT